MYHVRKIAWFLCICLFCLFSGQEVFSCTVFYLTNDSVVLAGNNEDWKDPHSKMWFYPATQNSHGWIKFGWGSGFPQGGMNDQGFFWDATSVPYLEMPYSEANKTLYQGALMQKVIQESARIEDALPIFSRYYCEDQYKAQYLLGDAESRSAIIEGDNVIEMQEDYMVLTNFYQSNPDLGGYPCWRYDLALDMIKKSNNYTTYLVGSMLSATHQEGKYPTQYSQIYDLKKCRIFLFYYHNYEEFIIIDLKDELKKGYRTCDIPELFSNIKMLSPAAGEKIQGVTVEFCWEGKADHNYELLYSTDTAFENCMSEYIIADDLPGKNNAGTILFFSALCILPLTKRRIRIQQFILIILLSFYLHCERDEISGEDENLVRMKKSASHLLPDTTYYWKIKSGSTIQDDFQSETLAKHFFTGNPVNQ